MVLNFSNSFILIPAETTYIKSQLKRKTVDLKASHPKKYLGLLGKQMLGNIALRGLPVLRVQLISECQGSLLEPPSSRECQASRQHEVQKITSVFGTYKNMSNIQSHPDGMLKTYYPKQLLDLKAQLSNAGQC